MSNFRNLQKEECRDLIVEEPLRPLTCPTCIPDLGAPNIKWFEQEEPYFDPRLCEYIINFTTPRKIQQISQLPLDVISDRGVKQATTDLLEFFAKEVSEENISLGIVTKGETYVDDAGLIHIRVHIPAIQFDKIPDLLEDPNPQSPENNANLPEEIVIDDTNVDFYTKFTITMMALRGYEFKYDFFKHKEGALLVEEDESKFIIFDAKKFRKGVEKFRDQLQKVLNKNGYALVTSNPLDFFSVHKRVSKIRIVLDNSDIEKPLKISRVFVEAEGCPEVEILKAMNKFKEESYNPAAIYFMTRFNDIYSDINSQDVREWIEFYGDYVYPRVVVKRGDNPEESKIVESGLDCVSDVDFGDILENALKDISLKAFDILDFEINKKACSQDPLEYDPGLKQYFDPDKQRRYEENYNKFLKKLKEDYKTEIQSFEEPLKRRQYEDDDAYNKRQKDREAKKTEFLQKLSDSAKEKANRIAESEKPKNLGGYAQALGNQFKESLDAKFNADNTVFEIYDEIFNNNSKSEDSETLLTKFLNTVGLCGFNEGLQKAMGCLLKQVSYEDIIKSAVKVTIDSLPPDKLNDILLAGLDPIKRIELKKSIAEKLNLDNPESIPWPWEARQTNAQIEKTKSQEKAIKEQYIEDLNEDLKASVVQQEGETEEEFQNRQKNLEDARLIYDNEYEKQKNIYVKENGPITSSNEDLASREIRKITLDILAQNQANKQLARPETEVAGILNEIGTEIIDTYIESLFQMFSIDDIIELYSESSFVRLITDFGLSFVECPVAPLNDIEENEIKSFKLDVCNPTLPVINIKLPKIPLLKSPLKFVSENLVKVIREAIVNVITTLIKQFLGYLENTLCASLEVLGKTALRPDQAFSDFGEVFRQAFCPDADNESAKELANNMFNKIGVTNEGVSSAVDCLGGALAGSISRNDILSLMIKENPSVDLLRRVSGVVSVGCPRLSDLFNTPDRVRDLFNNFRNLIPQATRDRINDMFDTPADSPIYNTICLTSEELEIWDNLRRNSLESNGLSPEDAANQIDLYNSRAREALEDAIRNLGNGQDQAVADELENLLNSNNEKPPGCDLKEGESNFGSKAIKEPEEIVRLQDDISDKIFDTMGDSFKREFASNPSPFGASLLEVILSDTLGNDYGRHRFLEDFFFTRMDYHDSEEDREKKESASIWTKSFGLNDLGFGEDEGYFPETIGQHLMNQLDEGGDYIVTPEVLSNYYNLPYVESDPDQNSSERLGYVSYLEKSDRSGSFDYKIGARSNSDNLLATQRVEVDAEVSQKIEEYLDVDLENYRRSIFKNFINEKISDITGLQIDYDTAFNKTSDLVFDSLLSLVAKDSDGFNFGYEAEDLTEEDLTYVGPNGEEPYSDFFTEEDKVLGKSKTDNERVFFLDPEEYGGSYTRPPLYIEPKPMSGWLNFSKIISPTEELCDENKENILKFSELKKYVNKSRNSMPADPRVNKSREECFVDRPFDKVLSKNALSSLDGISRLHIRMKLAETITLGLPIFTNLKYSQDNYDDTILDFVFDSLLKDLSNIDPFGAPRIEKRNYAMLVMEQLVQSYIRTNNNSQTPPEILAAIERIERFKENFTSLTIIENNETFSSNGVLEEPTFLLDSRFSSLASLYYDVGEKMFDQVITRSGGIRGIPVFNKKRYINFVCKIFAIRLALPDVKVIVKEIIKEELKIMLDHLHSHYDPKISNMSLHILTSDKLFANNTVENIGTDQHEKRIAAGIVSSTGEATDIVEDTSNTTPWNNTPNEEPIFKIEKYVRIFDKDNLESEELSLLLDNREIKFKGVVSLEKAQDLIDILSSDYGDSHISDIFGDAMLNEDGISYSGTIGMKYGIRIVAKLPNDSYSFIENPTMENLDKSDLEKAFITNHTNNNYDISIPLCSAEIELYDKKIKDVNVFEGDNAYDLDCMLRKLEKEADYRLLFHYLFPHRAASTMALSYSNYFFLSSIGYDDGWEDRAKQPEIKDNLFNDTSLLCRKYFSSFYESDKFINTENHKASKIEIPDFFKLFFGGFNAPEINLNAVLPKPWKFKHKIVKEKPFDETKRRCIKKSQ